MAYLVLCFQLGIIQNDNKFAQKNKLSIVGVCNSKVALIGCVHYTLHHVPI